MKNIETNRLIIREAKVTDASFIHQLLNNPTWIAHIGDRNIKTLKDAKMYIQNSLINSYIKYDFGMYIVIEKESQSSIGLCGFLKREELEFVDIGYAILPVYAGKGYTYEAANAVIEQSKFKFIYGITSHENVASQRLLQKLGLKYLRNFKYGNYEDESMLFFKEGN